VPPPLCNANASPEEPKVALTHSFLANAADSLLARTMKRKTHGYTLGVAVLLALLAAGTSAEAQRKQAPSDLWCREMQTGWGGGTVMICRAYTYEQCMAARTSHIETCYMNPLYDPRFADWRKRNPHY
jgi:hypothetical protein